MSINTTTITEAHSRTPQVLVLRGLQEASLQERVRMLIERTPFAPQLRQNIERGIRVLPSMDRLDESLALADLMIYTIRPAIINDPDNLQLAELDMQFRALLQERLPEGDTAEGFIDRKMELDAEVEEAENAIEQSADRAMNLVVEAVNETNDIVARHHADVQRQFREFNRHRQGMAEEASAISLTLQTLMDQMVQEARSAAEQLATSAEELKGVEKKVDGIYNAITKAVSK